MENAYKIKVENTAYAPLLHDLAEDGILCVLVKMPCNLAVLDRNAADSIPERFSEVTDWYIGGHSLGGAMAASYAAKHTDELDGLVLLAAYSTADLTDSGLRVYAAYGSEDGVLNRKNTKPTARTSHRTPPKRSLTAAVMPGSAATMPRRATARLLSPPRNSNSRQRMHWRRG